MAVLRSSTRISQMLPQAALEGGLSIDHSPETAVSSARAAAEGMYSKILRRRLRLLSCSAALLPFLVPGLALAQSFTVTNGQTVGTQTMTGANDAGVVQSGGTVAHSGGGSGAVNMNTGADQTLSNAGTISATTFNAWGVWSNGLRGQIDNSGIISTQGNFGYGILSQGADAIVDSSGNIITTGQDAYAILSQGAGAIITMDGDISTSNTGAFGILSQGANVTIDSSGNIQTSGVNGYAIVSQGISATITMDGDILTSNTGAHGILSQGANAVIDSLGAINLTGDNAYGIFSQAADANINLGGSITTSNVNGYGIITSAAATGANITITSTGSIQTSGGGGYAIIADGASATIHNYGTIDVQGFNTDGILSRAANHVIENSGSISSAGAFGSSIQTSGTNVVVRNRSTGVLTASGTLAYIIDVNSIGADIINDGTITATGNGSIGIRGTGPADNARIVNNGTITVNVDDGRGIVTDGNFVTIINNGTVTTKEDGALFSNGANASITNNGSLIGTGPNSMGIYSFGADAAIVNTGRITALDGAGRGIVSEGDDVVITNRGDISVVGYAGVWVDGANAVVTNDGNIIAQAGDAVSFQQGGATLNLRTDSFLRGTIHLAGSGNTINLATGTNTALFFSGGVLPDVVNTFGRPFILGGNSLVIFEPEGFTITDDMLFGLAGSVADAGARDGGQCLTPGASGSSCAVSAWISGIGGYSNHVASGGANAFSHGHGGLLAGLEFSPDAADRAGVFFGAAVGHGSVEQQQSTSMAGAVAGAHAGFERGMYFADVSASLGLINIDADRLLGALTTPAGTTPGRADYNAYVFSPAVTFGARMDLAGWALKPTLRVRYTGLLMQDYQEPSGDHQLSFDKRFSHELETRAQVALGVPSIDLWGGSLDATLRLGADAFSRRIGAVEAALPGDSLSFETGNSGTFYRGFAGLDVTYLLLDHLRLFTKVEVGRENTGNMSAQLETGLTFKF